MEESYVFAFLIMSLLIFATGCEILSDTNEIKKKLNKWDKMIGYDEQSQDEEIIEEIKDLMKKYYGKN